MSGFEGADQALRDLREQGRPADAFAGLLYDIVRAIARFGPFPPPSRHERWTDDDVKTVAHDFLADEHTPRRLATLATTSQDGRSFARQLEQTVRNYLRDEARKTDRSHLIMRLRDVMEADERFIGRKAGTDHLWALNEHADDDWVGSVSDLKSAALSEVDIPIVRWTGRRGPIAEREDLARLLDAILGSAKGAVPEPVIVDVVAMRFGLRLDATVHSLDDIPGPPLADPNPPEAADPGVWEEAARIWKQLTDRERIVLVNVELTDRELADAMGLSKSSANVARQRLVETLRTAIPRDSNSEEVYDALVRQARVWRENRTERPGRSSEHE